MNKKFFAVVFLLSCLFFGVSQAGDESVQNELKPEQLKQKLSAIFGGYPEDQIVLIPDKIPYFYLVRIQGKYGMVSQDGAYYIDGDLWNLDSREGITESIRNQYHLEKVKEVAAKEEIVFGAKDAQKAIWVFTDVDCFYCRKLHSEMKKINALGLAVNYIAFPRSGDDSTENWQKSVHVWCAKDQIGAMNIAKQGGDVFDIPQKKSCESDIETQYNTGRLVGVTGTPSIVMPNGELFPGYLPAEQLAARVFGSN